MIALIEFLKARIAEDKAIALAADNTPWEMDSFSGTVYSQSRSCDFIAEAFEMNAIHIAHNSPIKVLAGIDSKEVILNEYITLVDLGDDLGWENGNLLSGMELVTKALAAVYSDHPDYQKEWAL